MKPTLFFILFLAILLVVPGCTGKSGSGNPKQSADTIAVKDTGYTGIKQYMSGQYRIMDVTFKNGVRDGLMKSYYESGKLRQTFWYVNGLRQDSARWYYLEGQVFRATPYINDTVDGLQVQYYRTGKVKARLGYKKGFRTPFLEEFAVNGMKVTDYPDVVVSIKDNYKSNGTYLVSLELTNKSQRVKYFTGEFGNGVFDTVKCKRLKTLNGVGYLELKKGSSQNKGYVGVIAQILTNFNNNQLVYKKIELPYKDIN
jgi:antitoxin component YwqK of YwqJK toxin-antitoxin module